MLEIAVRRMEAAMARLEKSVLETPPSDFVQFREMVGRYRGLREAAEILYELLKGDDDSDDDPKFE